MKLAFILLKKSSTPIGGYKVVYDYANACISRGHEVTILYDYEWHLTGHNHLPTFLKKIIYFFNYIFSAEWYDLSDKVHKKMVWKLSGKELIGFDLIIATAAQTAKPVKNSAMNCKTLYFIQGYDNKNMTDDELNKTYNFFKHHIVISQGLQKKVFDVTKITPTLIGNGINIDVFKCEKAPLNRHKHSMAFMYHIEEMKGIREGLEVILRLKKTYPDLVVNMFGAYPKGKEIPEWVNYYEKATPIQLCDIYNSSRIFLSSSRSEGFGLTGAESMACGCALVSTSTEGAREYAIDKYNALLCEPQDVEGMYSNIVELFENDLLSEKIALRGRETILQKFNIVDKRNQFIDCVERLVNDK